jgi:AcrR family transcriptional regulator
MARPARPTRSASGGSSTRDRLIDAATALWAEQGSHLVSLNVIVERAGARNASALQYHFGNRDGLVDALFERHVPLVREARQRILRSSDASAPRTAAEALVLPLAALLSRDWTDRGFLCVAADLLGNHPQGRYERIMSMGGADAVNRLMLSHMSEVPPPLRAIRLRVAGMMVVHSLADEVRRCGVQAPPPDPAVFSENLVDMYLGSVLARQGLRPDPRSGDRSGLEP